MIPLLHRKTLRALRNVGRLWLAVLVANLLGAAIFAFLVTIDGLFAPEVHTAFVEIGFAAYAGTFSSLFMRGILAGYLIALMLWLLPEAQAAKVVVITVLAWVIGIADLPHIVAGSVEVLYLVAVGQLPFSAYAGDFMVPTLLGNITGGTMLVAALNHAQVTAGRAAGSHGRHTRRP